MIEIKNLKKYYELDGLEVKALDDLSIKIEDGEFVVILGRSGCGKSTLLNIMGGMDKPTSGEVIVNSDDIAKRKSNRLASYRRETVGMIFQKFNLINDMTILENVMIPLKFSGLSESEQKKIALKALKDVGLETKIKSVPSKLSGGQQQRVAIARALINNPSILLCDEPTGNLDSKTGDEIIQLLHSLNKEGRTIVMVTHDEEYTSIADHTIRMLDGKIIKEERKNQQKSGKTFQRNETKNISFFATIKLALRNIKRRKSRVFLTSFGIAIGAMAILVLVSFGAGLQNEANQQVKAFGQVNQISVSNNKTTGANFRGGPGANGNTNTFAISQSTPLNDQVITDFKKITNVSDVYPSIRLSGEMLYGSQIGRLSLVSAPPLSEDQSSIQNMLKYGTYFKSDNENSVIVPYGLAQALGFSKGQDAIGKTVTLENLPGNQTATATVIGVFDENQKEVTQSYMPVNSAVSFLKSTKPAELVKASPDLYDSIIVISKDNASVTVISQTITDKGYATHNYADTAAQLNRIFLMLQIGLGVVGAIAMLVASLGIINTMMMSILERTREIGIMKAVGARIRDIQGIFLTEAAFIGFIGGAFGLLLGYPGSKIASAIFNNMLKSNGGGATPVQFTIAPYLALGVLAFSILVAVIAGFFPARRGANLDPVVALRDE
jgi:macrolide transport system ATP-binding/permease protein